MERYDADVAEPRPLESTRSHEDEDAHRDGDGFNVDEELARLRRAIVEVRPLFSALGHEQHGHKQWLGPLPVYADREMIKKLAFIAEAVDNIDEHLLRLGALPKTWVAAAREELLPDPDLPGARLAPKKRKAARR